MSVGNSHLGEKIQLNFFLAPYIKTNSRWIKNLKLENETIKVIYILIMLELGRLLETSHNSEFEKGKQW